ncbi:MAG: dihydrodipicolinate synthase family protein [Haliscomenobacter sp.]|nr:dihydrodipicolinate synthase family protein [Haliscomenobacter sp.]MBK7474626.1 dihydrodipicolinate synthase family protein [Haliscomenobacter sp.]MBK8877727.1 dihydrodipicolinate synthase family protein [Haliscomenobacter sp.]
MRDIQFRGVIPPLVTPFAPSGEIDYAAHRFNLQRWNQQGLAGYLVLGSNSEAASLSESEKLTLIEQTAAQAKPDHIILAGTGMDSTVETIRLSNEAARCGAHAALLLTPFYYKDALNEAAQIRHFLEVAEKCRIPVMIYNVPKYTQVNLSNKVIATLSQHPNIIGMKDSSGNIAQLVEFQRVADPSFQILVGTASVWYPALILGVQAGIMALANCAPEVLVRIQELTAAKEMKEAERLYRQWVPVNQAVTATYGVSGLKYACNLRGYQAGTVRSPLQELEEPGRKAIEQMLNERPE